MKRRRFIASAAAAALARPALAQSAKGVLRFVPQANLANPDPVWSTATMATIHGLMVWDMLYGVDEKLVPQPQMCAGHEVSDDELTWVFTLREGLRFHDGVPVRAADCVASVRRWAERNPFGLMLVARLNEMAALDDRRFRIRLKEPFRPLLFAFGATSCFMMPERIARTPASTSITEFTGSGPFRFLPDQWVSGARAEYARFEGYVPRQEAAEFYAGGKVVHFERVQWLVQPDAATAAAALQGNEVDWVEQPLMDLVAKLRSTPGITVAPTDPLGTVDMLIFNQLQPPFDNAKLRRALWPAIDQKAFLQGVVGEQADLGRDGVGFFPLGTEGASATGMEALTGERSIARARQAVAESGYAGEKVVMLEPTDVAQLQAVAQIAADIFRKVGLNVEEQSMDLGTLVGRRNKQEGVAQGGWSCAPVQWNSLPIATPLSAPMSAIGRAGWVGWPSSEARAGLQRKWLEQTTPAGRKAVCAEIQAEAFGSVPFVPACQFFQPAAYRSDLGGFNKAAFSTFWGVRRG